MALLADFPFLGRQVFGGFFSFASVGLLSFFFQR
jgi:hypothetical protein